jgi:hypothetical protein
MMIPDVWRKSTHSGPWTDNCVEVCQRGHDDMILVRNTRARDEWTLEFTRDEWIAFIAGARDGEFDLS